VRASSVQSPCDPSCSAPTNGRAQNASCLSFSERFCFGFQRGEVPSGAEGFTPNDSPANFPEDPPILPTDSATDPEIAACPEFDFLIPCSCPSRATRPPLPVQPLGHPREREPVPFLKGPFSDAVVCARRLPVAVRTERHARVVGRLLAHPAVRPGMSGFAPPFDPQAIEGISRIHPKYALLRGGPLRVGDVAL